MKAVVIGGGMSGLAAAINLLDLGIEVELFESDEILGGRASSWKDEDGDLIDNALHVFFPYYVNLLSFFGKLGIEHNLLWKNTEFYYSQPGGENAVLRIADLPAPLHAVYGLAHLLKDYREVPRWKAIRAALPFASGMLLSKNKIDKLDDISLATLVYRYSQLEDLKYMEPGINGLTFTPSYAVSAKVMLNWGLKVFSTASCARVGFANGGLGDIWVGTCLDYIKGKGGKVHLKKAVKGTEVEGGKVKHLVMADSRKVEADLYISAVNVFSLRGLLPDEAYDLEYFRDLWYFTYSPSLSLMIWFDRKLTDVDSTFFANDCIFNTFVDLSNVLPDIHRGGSIFEMVLSPADHLQAMPDKLIFDIALEQIKERFLLARDANVRKYRIIRERQGIYRPSPGMEKYRPFQRSPYDNLYLTGDYTKTHVSSAGMEAAIWNSNKVAELVAYDKLGKKVSLNLEFKPNEPLMKYMKPVTLGAALLGAVAVGKRLSRKAGQ